MTNYETLIDYFSKTDLARWLASINCQCNRNLSCPAYKEKEPRNDVNCKGADSEYACMILWLNWLEEEGYNNGDYNE